MTGLGRAEEMEGIAGKAQMLLVSEDAEHARQEADKTGEKALVRDIDIKIFDHGTGRIDSLTVGISVLPGAT